MEGVREGGAVREATSEGVPHADIDAALGEVYEVFGIARRVEGGS